MLVPALGAYRSDGSLHPQAQDARGRVDARIARGARQAPHVDAAQEGAQSAVGVGRWPCRAAVWHADMPCTREDECVSSAAVAHAQRMSTHMSIHMSILGAGSSALPVSRVVGPDLSSLGVGARCMVIFLGSRQCLLEAAHQKHNPLKAEPRSVRRMRACVRANVQTTP